MPIRIFGLQVVRFGLGHPRRTGRSLEGKPATQVTGQALTVSTGSACFSEEYVVRINASFVNGYDQV